MKLAEPGRQIIKRWESLALKTYICPAGVPTIGFGHTGKDVVAGMVITAAEAEILLTRDVAVAEAAVNRLITSPLTQNQFDALCSFTFNLGSGSLQASTLRRVINRGDYHLANAEFGKWVWAGGKRLRGLVSRRKEEAELFDMEQSTGEIYASNDNVGGTFFSRLFSGIM